MDLLNNIDERDLFNFVFFYELLSEEKKEMLNKYEAKYEQIQFYKNLKNNLVTDIGNKIKEKLAVRIPAYKKSTSVIRLFPINFTPEQRPQEMPILFAASAVEEPKVVAKSFVDEDKTFVLRMIRMDNKTRIYPFPLLTNKVQKLKITLHPSEKTYTVDSDKHLELDISEEIESISVEAVN